MDANQDEQSRERMRDRLVEMLAKAEKTRATSLQMIRHLVVVRCEVDDRVKPHGLATGEGDLYSRTDPAAKFQPID